jgi:hypothetical protein
MALTDAGEVLIWGSNDFCQHGMDSIEIEKYQTQYELYLHFQPNEAEKLSRDVLPTF